MIAGSDFRKSGELWPLTSAPIDGSVKRIEIAQSSGFDDLDQSALDTVLKRWRFVAAKRSDGRPVESWVLVPIRFALR